MDIVNQNLGQLPIPSVEGIKKFIADQSLIVAEAAKNVRNITFKYNLESVAVNSNDDIKNKLLSEKSEAIIHFYNEASFLIFSPFGSHIATEDIKQFNDIKETLEGADNAQDLFDVKSVYELNTFIQQALKNSNLLELGQKSHLREIINEIDVSVL